MFQTTAITQYHIQTPDWQYTSSGEQRGFIQPQRLSELWFHTGTACNLSCPFCFEGAGPKNFRLQAPTRAELLPFMKEAKELGTQQFSFTGGEPFVCKEIIPILSTALDMAPSLVLTNGTTPLQKNLKNLSSLKNKRFPLQFRISLDAPTAEAHDLNRGSGAFARALESLIQLQTLGFTVSVARHRHTDTMKDKDIEKTYHTLFQALGLQKSIQLVSFPDLFPPCSIPEVPNITEHCMTTYKTQEEREHFMCNYSKMIIKKDGKIRVYACTLVDDDINYDLGDSLTDAMRFRIMLRHHRCFSCFAAGTSCSN